jgi:hypothetical protein
MNRYARTGVVLLALFAAACDDFIQGPGLTENPNSPTQGTAQQQMIAIHQRMTTLLEGQLARTAGIYTQQIVGFFNQQLTVTRYQYSESDYSGFFSGFYTGGGLVAIRNVQAQSAAADDKLLEGIAKVWEGLAIGTASSIWGDLPYSEALRVDIVTPKLDAQRDVYDAVQRVLDEGITALRAASTAGNCDPADLIYCATTVTRQVQINRWIAAANTLKARFYLDLVERDGNAAYTLALAAANQGINEAATTAAQAMHGQAPGDFRMYHGNVQDLDSNIWAGFLGQRNDVSLGEPFRALLVARNDPRLAAYFNPISTGQFVGRDGSSTNTVIVGGSTTASDINSPVRRALNFRQPIVTWAENQLILAEAKFRLQNADAALPHVNAVRTAVGLPELGAVTFQDVAQEKFIAMFQNIAAWSDFRRTCPYVIQPNASSGLNEVPGRLPYGSAERLNNPNLPSPSTYPAGTSGSSAQRNWNDPQPCPTS